MESGQGDTNLVKLREKENQMPSSGKDRRRVLQSIAVAGWCSVAGEVITVIRGS